VGRVLDGNTLLEAGHGPLHDVPAAGGRAIAGPRARGLSRRRRPAHLHIAGNINAAIISYLRAKVISSLLLAIGSGIVLAARVKFVVVWMLLTFLFNFIPYVGSVVCTLCRRPTRRLQLPPWGGPIAVAVLLLGVQIARRDADRAASDRPRRGPEPAADPGRAGLWGTLCGLPGMFLAVPLTVVLKIVLHNIEATRPLAQLAEE